VPSFIRLGYSFAAIGFLQDAEFLYAVVDRLCKDKLVNMDHEYNDALEPALLFVDRLCQGVKYPPAFYLLQSALSSISSFFNRKQHPTTKILAFFSLLLCPHCGCDLTLS
jgi:hypothetical protein